MKILYAIQGTGNGHISRARDIIPLLQEKGELDILVSGIQADMELPYPVKYQFNGLSFIFGKSGGVDLLATLRKSRFTKLMREINSLPVEEYDLVINDFEPVSAWACRLKNKVCIGLSHQSAVINPGSPRPESQDALGKTILSSYAPVSYSYGFHFQAYAERIATPVIRRQIREASPLKKNYYTVYLPAYDDKRIIKTLSMIPEVQWQVFSKHTKKAYTEENITIRPVNNEEFIHSLVNCTGILCGAGFETPAEALFLKKKLMVIPMKGQYEQQCNAAALAEMDVDVIKSLKKKNMDKIKQWTESEKYIHIDYPDITGKIVTDLIENYKPARPHGSAFLQELSVLPPADH